MFRPCAKIEIKGVNGGWVFGKVASIEITRDIDTLTDICVLQLPKKINWAGSKTLPLKRGDSITVRLGYDDKLSMAFQGFITTIGLKTPISITCEDYMFKIKALPAKKLAYKSATVDKILTDQTIGIPHKVYGEQNIGQYRITADTVSGVLGQLKDNGGIRSFIKIVNNTPMLYCGVLFGGDKSRKQVYKTGLNIIDDTQLESQNAADVKIKVKAVSLMSDNKKVKCEVGDADGEVRTVHTYNKKLPELTAWAKQELQRLKRDGLTGSFTTFGGDLVDKLDNIGIVIDGERKGVYQVDKNVIKYSTGGFRQEITIGARVAG